MIAGRQVVMSAADFKSWEWAEGNPLVCFEIRVPGGLTVSLRRHNSCSSSISVLSLHRTLAPAPLLPCRLIPSTYDDRVPRGRAVVPTIVARLESFHHPLFKRLDVGPTEGRNEGNLEVVDQDRRACAADFGLSTITGVRTRPSASDSDTVSLTSFFQTTSS